MRLLLQKYLYQINEYKQFTIKCIIYKTLLYINNYDSPQFKVFYDTIMLQLAECSYLLVWNMLLKWRPLYTSAIWCKYILQHDILDIF